ncbi:MAG: type IV pilus secretin PilQ [Geobacteraceae bacterium]|nr:type IV pilus secretin PilQ [Geobacteraceae bacterium]
MKWMTKTSMVLALAFLVSAGKATVMPDRSIAAQEGIKASSGKLVAIKSINVTGEGAATELVILLSSPATYTSYKTTAPLRLVLDLSQASQGVITSPQVINKGNFKTVTATRFDTDAGVLTRIDIELNKDAEAVITASTSNPGELRVSFPAITVKDVAPLRETLPKPAVAAPTPTVLSPATKGASPAPAASLRRLTSITAGKDKIEFSVEGGVADFNSFRLSKPERFVVDIMDTQLAMTSRMIPLNTSGVASARIGLYPDKVRIVLDSVNGDFPEATATKSGQGITVALSVNPNDNPNTKLVATRTEKPVEATVPAAKTAQAVPTVVPAPAKPVAAPVPVVKPQLAAVKTEAPKTVPKAAVVELPTVEMIDFQVVENISRVAVKVKGDVTVEQPVKSPGFVTLTVKNAGLSKQLQRSLETKSFISPVLRITPLLVKTRKGTDTKIRIAMRAAAPFVFRQESDMIFVDFKNPEGLSADKLPSAFMDAKAPSARPVKNGNAKENELASEIAPVMDAPVRSADGARVYKGRKVTLEFADAEVRKIFQLLSEVSNKNFVLGDDVTGTISIKLVNVPWDQAMDIILDTKGLDKREDGNIIIIKGKGKFKSQADEDLELKRAQSKAIELKTELFNINYSDIGAIVTQLEKIKTPDRGVITPDIRTNKIIAKDIPQALDDMRRLINQLDVPEKQVMIEARIVEATSTFTRSLGVNWGLHYRDGMGSFMGINQLDTSFGGQASTPAPTSGLSGQSGGAMGISFGTLTSNISLDLRLNAAASAGLIKIVSTPKVATLNNKTAKITQGQQVPYTSSTSDKVETKFVEAALSLEVTPHINANGTIGMKIDAKNDSVGQATGGSTAPAINKKQATTEMLLRDGETTVIGGIYVDSDNESDDGVPYLMDIPFLGKLFKSNLKTKVKTELLIFITPRILNTI